MKEELKGGRWKEGIKGGGVGSLIELEREGRMIQGSKKEKGEKGGGILGRGFKGW